jgi:mRNA-degrading endonuclease RelE of RelBE toxin-antitoxin system
MNFEVCVTSYFKRQSKKLLKKYPSLKHELASLIENLSTLLIQGSSLGRSCYKIRLSIASKGSGKSGGARVITYVQVIDKKVNLLSIYDKSEIPNISGNELSTLLKSIE